MATMIVLKLHDGAETPHYAKAEAIENLVQRGHFTELHMASGARFNVVETAQYILGYIPSTTEQIRERINLENSFKERCCRNHA